MHRGLVANMNHDIPSEMHWSCLWPSPATE